MKNTHVEDLIDNILNNDLFALIPHNPKPERELKFLFDFFTNLKVDLIMRALEKEFDNPNLERGLSVLFHYKGKIPYYKGDLTFQIYSKLKPFLDDKSLEQFKILFYKTYAADIINGKTNIIDNNILDYISTQDLTLYIDISLKLKLDNITTVFSIDKTKVFYWINQHPHKYNQLRILNQPQFIFNNMNGKLDINDETLKYFFEICPIDLEVYKELKKTINLETIWKFTHNKLTIEFIMELVDTLDEIIFVLSMPDLSLASIDSFMKRIEIKFPHLYSNFNSLLLMKKVFSQ